MSLLHWILNLAALFLWIDWRTGSAARPAQPVISLAASLRDTSRRRARGWSSLAGVVALLGIRPFFYYSVGSAAGWTPVLDLPALSLPFRSDLLNRMFLYSSISFALVLVFFYGVLLLMDAVRTVKPESEVMRRFIRAQLGWLAWLPWPAKILAPFAAVAGAWAALVPLFVSLEIMPASPGPEIVWQQAGILSMSALLAWQWFFAGLFLLYGLNSYVYLGSHPAWVYLGELGATLLRPLWFLRIGKLDFAPFAAAGALLALSEYVIRPLVLRWFERTIA